MLFFCDEAGQVADEWCSVAGLSMPRQVAGEATKDLARIKAELNRNGEVKWVKAKSFNGKIQRAYINYLFDQIGMGRMHFHIRFNPMGEYNHNLSGPRKRIDTVSKSFYQLLLHRAARHYSKHHVVVIPDDGDCTSALPDQLGALKYEAGNKYGPNAYDCIQKIQPRSSESEPMLQLLDVTLGALASYRNGRHLSASVGIKRELAEYAFERTGWPTITGNCPAYARAISRWNVTPKIHR
ncbi:DUF3800 domain-containing protein [Paracoccus onubensis]|uniref:DUF3800 domain-containing protein n=1 Tax=Paracoccus onubensis TaxID=1675788 RepID=A0A418SS88_9RHOB|nr:DUF3800 domain-containing protein [Paracoccus onubensis]